MSKELLAILEQIERDKGIKREKLMETIEQALTVAAKKIGRIINPEAEVKVEIDIKTGKIRTFIGKEEISSDRLGRIAAQTARQVIIQKIREAEKEVVYNDFKDKVGSLVSGSVYRIEKKGVVLDLLGKTEAFIPRGELSPLDRFRLGERVKAYCLEVREDRKPQVIASRRTTAFVKKLFELEVPEIYDGIVEIRSISRDAGDRTKIAVYSKDDKVDCVGACVGIKGTRVKNIVEELRGEKIDIVRYSEDLASFIKAALLPAQIARININKDKTRALVVVNSDQLSLAIGRYGQNVRLASRLCGIELDVRSEEQLKEDRQKLAKLKGVGKGIINVLVSSGYDSLKNIATAEEKDLALLKGIGKKKARAIIEAAREALRKEEENR